MLFALLQWLSVVGWLACFGLFGLVVCFFCFGLGFLVRSWQSADLWCPSIHGNFEKAVFLITK